MAWVETTRGTDVNHIIDRKPSDDESDDWDLGDETADETDHEGASPIEQMIADTMNVVDSGDKDD